MINWDAIPFKNSLIDIEDVLNQCNDIERHPRDLMIGDTPVDYEDPVMIRMLEDINDLILVYDRKR